MSRCRRSDENFAVVVRTSTRGASHHASTASMGSLVLSAGSTPDSPFDAWMFQIRGAVDRPISWTWHELRALPAGSPTVDIHCVAAWSKLDTRWRGVSVDTLLAGLETEAMFVRAWWDDGYRTNLPLDEVSGGGPGSR